MSKIFVMADIHGMYKGMKQCLERSNFDYDNDTLIQLGDIVDGYPEVYECFEELSKIRNLILIKGNHDDWFNEYLQKGVHPTAWKQGALGTAKSYLRQIDKEDLIVKASGAWGTEYDPGYLVALNPEDVPPMHQKLLREQRLYYIDDKNRLFIHGGFNRHDYIEKQYGYIFYWDRDLWQSALSFQSMIKGEPNPIPKKKQKFKVKDNFDEIFIGHTTTLCWNTDKPMKAAMIWNLDTGGGFKGKITIMNVDTHEYWQSDSATELYPNDTPR